MADPTPVPEIQADGILLLPSPQYLAQYSRMPLYVVQTHRTQDQWVDFDLALKDKTRDVFVQFIDPGSKRYGTIAKARPYLYRYDNRGNAPFNPAVSAYRTLEVYWDGRRTTDTVSTYHEAVTWLPNYTGETVWAYDRTRKFTDQKIVKDRLDRDIKVGDFCSYILYHFDSNGAAGIYFGKVTKIEKDGTVWFKNIKLGEDDKVAEKRVKDNSNIIILTKDLLDQLMLARLSVL